jgi:hypothetical protein
VPNEKRQLEGVEIRHPSDFWRSIGGESFHQATLEAIDGGRCAKGETVMFWAYLLPEDGNSFDSKAVKLCDPEQRQVGYLRHGDAARYRPLVDDLLSISRFLMCPAKLLLGKELRARYTILLSLPDVDNIVSSHFDLFRLAEEPSYKPPARTDEGMP